MAKLVAALASRRLELGFSQETLSKLSGLSRPGISHMEAGRTTPTLLSLLKLSAALEIKLSDYLAKAEKR